MTIRMIVRSASVILQDGEQNILSLAPKYSKNLCNIFQKRFGINSAKQFFFAFGLKNCKSY
jgi:hypothetical protein